MDAITGKIFDIKRFAVHDGEGIRTTVFMKGCPLHCEWCHNPEGISFDTEVQYMPHKCLNCGECTKVCKKGAHTLVNGKHQFDRSLCVGCGNCEKVCIGQALILCGKEMTVDEVVEIVLEDREFYEQSGGGVTLSGGECLCQADFCAELLKQLKKEGIHCAVDTSGCVTKSVIDRVAPYTDIFLYDIKHMDEDAHRRYTGQSNRIILDNLKYIDTLHKKIEVRIPLIPTINDAAIDEIGRFLSGLDMLQRVKVLAYNNLAGSKYEMLGKENTMPKVAPPTKAAMEAVIARLQAYGLNVV